MVFQGTPLIRPPWSLTPPCLLTKEINHREVRYREILRIFLEPGTDVARGVIGRLIFQTTLVAQPQLISIM